MKNFNLKSIFNMRKNAKVKIGILIFLCLIIGLSIFSISRSLLVAEEEIKSVEIKSDGWDENVPGAWKVTKSTEWTGIDTVKLSMEVNSLAKVEDKPRDIVIAIDNSNGLLNEVFDKEKKDVIELIEAVLSKENNRVALVTTNLVLSEFTNDKDNLTSLINNLEKNASYISYTSILNNIAKVIGTYNNEDSELTSLFLVGSYSARHSWLLPGLNRAINNLKVNYPYLNKKTIQYGMGSTIVEDLKEISDEQYIASIIEAEKNVLFQAASLTEAYELFEIEEEINYAYFDIEDIISNSNGKVHIDNNKIIWEFEEDKLYTESITTLEIELKLKDEYLNHQGVYSTSNSIAIASKFQNEEEVKVTSNKTPIVQVGFNITYDTNPPTGCNIKNTNTELHFAFENITMPSEELTCEGYQFKGWEVVEDDIQKINDDIFIMPQHDISIKAIWTKLDISKSMDGTIYVRKFIMPFNNVEADLDSVKSVYVPSEQGINWGRNWEANGQGLYIRAGTEDDDYPIYYYRGESANNVLFAGLCWSIMRTTEKGGTKLLYSGLPNNQNQCTNIGTTNIFIGKSKFHETTETKGAYMFGENKNIETTLKQYIDYWYEANLITYTDYFEDAVWCNELTLGSTSSGSVSAYQYYDVRDRLQKYAGNITNYTNAPHIKDNEACPNVSDRFTVSTENGNGKLKYPIALLTADEAWLGGVGHYSRLGLNSSYLSSPDTYYWLLSPMVYLTKGGSNASVAGIDNRHFITTVQDTQPHYVRPAIVLKEGITASSGDGTASNPYTVEIE